MFSSIQKFLKNIWAHSVIAFELNRMKFKFVHLHHISRAGLIQYFRLLFFFVNATGMRKRPRWTMRRLLPRGFRLRAEGPTHCLYNIIGRQLLVPRCSAAGGPHEISVEYLDVDLKRHTTGDSSKRDTSTKTVKRTRMARGIFSTKINAKFKNTV